MSTKPSDTQEGIGESHSVITPYQNALSFEFMQEKSTQELKLLSAFLFRDLATSL